MKKRIAVLLALLLIFSLTAAAAGNSAGGDYSWLDDLTIRQLKELDAEIHKRIPYEGEAVREPTGPDASVLIGTWVCNVKEHALPKDSPFAGHDMRYTLEFMEGGVGTIAEEDLTEGKLQTKLSFDYEMRSETLVWTGVSGLMEIAYKIEEDEEGLKLTRVADELFVHRKVEE